MKRTLRTTVVGLAALAVAATSSVGGAIADLGLPELSAQEQSPTASGGMLYAATNEVTGNRIAIYRRGQDGQLAFLESVPTGGTGSGGFEGSANGVILASRGGESSPNNLTGGDTFLFATNTGSGSVSVFRTVGDSLELVENESAGINHPISVTVSHGIVYVLNGGATNCLGGAPSITGFRLEEQGALTPIPGSTRPVSGGAASGCTQVSFTPGGDVLVVTEKNADVISTYTVDSDGLAAGPLTNQTSGNGPFGFTFTQTGRLLTAENSQGAALQGAASSYGVARDGSLTPVSGPVRNNRSDTCWMVLTDNQRYAYVTNAMSNDISSYRVDPDGTMTLLESIAGPADELPAPFAIPADLTLSRDSRFLYPRNVRDCDIFAFEVRVDGTLVLIQTLPRALPPGAIGVAGT